ncbi:MAG TPA: glycosyltransferase [Salinivirgaceae bacterium]|nr:glycosyltransferase [Salinivirgaceae bacterium]
MSNMLVSVIMITFNHEKYISQAIEGVLMQEIGFPYELIIANDCSPDNTDAIVKDYINHHPKGKIIKYFSHAQNIGMQPNFIFAAQHCTGKYIALCEGDDYWTDPLKLQKQVDFLERNPEYNICFHDVEILAPNPEVVSQKNIQWNDRDTFTTDDLLDFGNIMHTPSVVFRNIVKEYPFKNAITGDYFLHLMVSLNSKIFRIKETMAVYRVHDGGFFSQKERWSIEKKISFFEKQIESFFIFYENKELTARQKKRIELQIFNLRNALRFCYSENREFLKSSKLSIKLLLKLSNYNSVDLKLILSIILNIFFPYYFYVKAQKKKNNVS